MLLHTVRSRRRGSVLPLVVVCLVALIGMVALAIDLGLMMVARTQCQNAADAADFLTKTPNSVALVEQRFDTEFHQRLTQQNFVAEPLGNVKGLNYSRGDQVSLTLYRLRKTGP